jgi:ferric-dicitrate binding protein FerR (iron transport regulator)
MTCADVRERSFDYFYDLLEAEERSSLEAHLRDCEACREALRVAAEQKKMLRDQAPVPRGLAERTIRRVSARPRFWRLAAAAALLVAAFLAPLLTLATDGIVWVEAGRRRTVAAGAEVGEGVIEYPDGSRATLWARGRGRVRQRRLELDAGEASLRVQPGREPFIVRTPAADVTVLGTEFEVRLTGEDMNRKSLAAGSGVLLTVAVVTGIVRVSNDRGEVLLRADETAAARPGEGPRRVTEADLERIARETRLAQDEAAALEAETVRLRRAGKAMLLELQQRPAIAAPKPTKKSPLGDLMKAQMSASIRVSVKTEVDKLDRRLHLSPEQRKIFEASYEKVFTGLFEALSSGNFDKLSSGRADPALDPNLLLQLTPEQREEWNKLQAEEAEQQAKAEQAAEKKAFESAAAALGLSDAQKASLEGDLTKVITDAKTAYAQLLLQVFSGKMSAESLEAERESIVQGAVDKVKERLTAEQSEAFRGHLRKEMQLGAIRFGAPSKGSDK